MLESNDHLGDTKTSTKTRNKARSSGLPTLEVYGYHSETELSESGRALISGYQIVDSTRIRLMVEPIEIEGDWSELADHRDLNVGQSIEVTVAHTVSDHECDFLEMLRMDGRGSFFLNIGNWRGSNECRGFHDHDLNFHHCLDKGRVLAGVVVRQGEYCKTFSLRPTLQAYLKSLPKKSQLLDGKRRNLYEAKVLEEANEWGNVIVGLDAKPGEPNKWNCVFEVHYKLFEKARISNIEPGKKIMVRLSINRSRDQPILKPNISEAFVLAERYPNLLEVHGSTIKQGKSILTPSAFKALLELEEDAEWQSLVCDFYTQSLFWRVSGLLPKAIPEYLEFSGAICRLITNKREELQSTHDCRIRISNGDTVEISASTEENLAEVKAQLAILAESDYISVSIPSNTIGRVIGPKRSSIKLLVSTNGIIDVLIDDKNSVLTVYGKSTKSVKDTIETIQYLVGDIVGELIIPSSLTGKFIGKGGEAINRLRTNTGCEASQIGQTGTWHIKGDNKHSIETFSQLAISSVGSGSFRIINSGLLKVVDKQLRIQKAFEFVKEKITKQTEKPSSPVISHKTDSKSSHSLVGGILTSVASLIKDILVVLAVLLAVLLAVMFAGQILMAMGSYLTGLLHAADGFFEGLLLIPVSLIGLVIWLVGFLMSIPLFLIENVTGLCLAFGPGTVLSSSMQAGTISFCK
jgi:hypothetical protein